MSLTPKDEILSALKEAYVPAYYASLYRQQRYAFGEKWSEDDSYGDPGEGADFPSFPSHHVQYLPVGQSRRILTTSFVDLTRNMYSPGDPVFPQVDNYTAEIRRQYWLVRSDEGDWDTARASAFMEGNGLGVGFLQIGFEKNPRTGKMRTKIRHSPTLQTLWDPHEPSAGRARYVAFVQTLPANKAIALFGDKAAAHVDADTTGPAHRLRTVRVFEYYDLGLDRWEPTRAVILGKMSNEPILVRPSLFKERLPMAFYEHLLAPGLFRPVGRVPMQMPTQEALNTLEGHMLASAMKRPVDIYDSTIIDPSDFAKIQANTSNAARSLVPIPAGVAPFIRIPAEEISASALQTLNYLREEFNEASGTNEYDRSSRPDGNLTATEVGEIQSQSAKQGGWADKQTDKFAARTVIAVLDAAAIGDTDPLTLDIFGANVPINDPKEPASAIGGFLEEPSRTYIKPGSLQYQDVQREGAQRLQQLGALQPLVGQTVQVGKFTEEVLRAIGEEDPKSWMQAPPAPPVDPAAADPNAAAAGAPAPPAMEAGPTPPPAGV